VNPISPTKTFHLILIKPSHYDDAGYAIQWILMFYLAYRQVVHGVTQGADDLAMQPVQAHELDTLVLFTATSAA